MHASRCSPALDSSRGVCQPPRDEVILTSYTSTIIPTRDFPLRRFNYFALEQTSTHIVSPSTSSRVPLSSSLFAWCAGGLGNFSQPNAHRFSSRLPLRSHSLSIGACVPSVVRHETTRNRICFRHPTPAASSSVLLWSRRRFDFISRSDRMYGYQDWSVTSKHLACMLRVARLR